MKNFKDFMYEREDDNEELNEEAGAGGRAIGLLGAGIFTALGGSHVLFAASRGFKQLIYSWKVAVNEFKSLGELTTDTKDFSKYIDAVRKDPLIKKVYNDEQNNQRKYADVLKDVYEAIDDGAFTKENAGAAAAFAKIPRNLQNNPDVRRAVASEIVSKLGEPPLWPPSPGNKTYQAIKYTLGIRDAKAHAEAFKMNIIKKMKEEE